MKSRPRHRGSSRWKLPRSKGWWTTETSAAAPWRSSAPSGDPISMVVEMVPVKGGRWHIIPQLAVYTTYILPSGQLYTTYTANWGIKNATDPTLYIKNQKQPLT